MGLEEVARAVRNKSQLWNVLRIAILMMRRGLFKSTALLQEYFQVLRKRGVKVFGKNLQLFHRHHMSTSPRGFGLLDHEFSCSNSPANPPFNFTKKKLITAQHYFSCIQPQTVESPTSAAASWLQQMNTIQSSEGVSSMETYQLAQGEDLSSSTAAEGAGQVDIEAKEFIHRFYRQIKFQCQISLLQYYEMLAKGDT